jgi:hypothetical protein
MFSRNSASSRAIPFEKMVKMVEEDPFIPIAWQKHHKGMQGTEYLISNQNIEDAELEWFSAKTWAIDCAKRLHSAGVTKQLCNRLLEPFMWYTTLVTATEYDNFFDLRLPSYGMIENDKSVRYKSKKDLISKHPTSKDWGWIEWQSCNISQAEIHIQELAEAMWNARNESIPKKLVSGEWHIPFNDEINDDYILEKIATKENTKDCKTAFDIYQKFAIQIATARCARLSYMTFDGEIDYGKDIKLHDRLLESKHMSPFEHCARAMTDKEYFEFAKGRMLVKDGYGDGDSLEQDFDNTDGWCNNFRGFIPYRYLIENNM